MEQFNPGEKLTFCDEVENFFQEKKLKKFICRLVKYFQNFLELDISVCLSIELRLASLLSPSLHLTIFIKPVSSRSSFNVS